MVTRAVTLTTESSGRPETTAGRKTLPGMVASAVLAFPRKRLTQLRGAGRRPCIRWPDAALMDQRVGDGRLLLVATGMAPDAGRLLGTGRLPGLLGATSLGR